jgi:hypothetical protein
VIIPRPILDISIPYSVAFVKRKLNLCVSRMRMADRGFSFPLDDLREMTSARKGAEGVFRAEGTQQKAGALRLVRKPRASARREVPPQ